MQWAIMQKRHIIEWLVRKLGAPVEKSLESIDREKAGGKGECAAQRSLGWRLSRSNRECAGFLAILGFSRYLLSGISLLRLKRQRQRRGQSLHLRQRGLEKAGYLSTTLPQNVALRPSMSGFCMMLGGYFMDSFKYGRSGC